CESRDNYSAANPNSSARGAYQFLTGSWASYGHKDRYGVSSASQATPAQQDEAALITWQQSGTSPWNASKSCWG
ncbi:MAG: transglycosylase family protein, partial [Acidimicrobiales bacterium]